MPLTPDVETRDNVECELKNECAGDVRDVAVKVTDGEPSLIGYLHAFSLTGGPAAGRRDGIGTCHPAGA